MSSGFTLPTVTRLFPYPEPLPFPAARYLCRAWWTCHSTARGHTWRQRSDCLLATAEPLSVMSPFIRHELDACVAAEPGWTGPVPDWQGIPCQIGRVGMWLPVEGNLSLRSFSLLVLLPRREATDVPPFIRLGTQFLLEYRATLTLDGSSGSPALTHGQLLIPAE